MKKINGITLISLVITILALLILAGVSVAMITGENGILTKATTAKEKNDEAQNHDNERLKELENKVAKYESIESNRDIATSSTVLWTGDITSIGEDATLSESIENYKYILLETSWETSTAFIETVLNVDTIKEIGYRVVNNGWEEGHTLINMYDDSFLYVTFSSKTSLFIPHKGGNPIHLKKVIGIK